MGIYPLKHSLPNPKLHPPILRVRYVLSNLGLSRTYAIKVSYVSEPLGDARWEDESWPNSQREAIHIWLDENDKLYRLPNTPDRRLGRSCTASLNIRSFFSSSLSAIVVDACCPLVTRLCFLAT